MWYAISLFEFALGVVSGVCLIKALSYWRARD